MTACAPLPTARPLMPSVGPSPVTALGMPVAPMASRATGAVPPGWLLLAATTALVVWCGLLSAIDLRERRLPNSLTITGAVGVLVFAIATGRGGVAITGALLLALPYLACHLVSPAAIGAGDVKLALGLGGAAACGGAQAWVWAAITAPVLTAVTGAALLVPWHHIAHRLVVRPHRRPRSGLDARGSPPDSAVPHGPSMCLSTVAALLLTH